MDLPTDDGPLAGAVWAGDLHVCVHPGKDLCPLDLDSLSVAASAADDVSVRRGSRPSAVVAEDVLVELKLRVSSTKRSATSPGTPGVESTEEAATYLEIPGGRNKVRNASALVILRNCGPFGLFKTDLPRKKSPMSTSISVSLDGPRRSSWAGIIDDGESQSWYTAHIGRVSSYTTSEPSHLRSAKQDLRPIRRGGPQATTEQRRRLP